MCYVRSNVVFFLGYEIKFLSKQEKRAAHARRELSFKKLRNQKLAKQQGLQDKYNRVLQTQISAAMHHKIRKFCGGKTGFTGKLWRKGLIKELEAYVDYLKKINYKKNLINPFDAFNSHVGKSKTVLPETQMLDKVVTNYGTSHQKNRIKDNQQF